MLHKESGPPPRDQGYSAALVAAALDCIVLMDHEGKVIEFNPAAERTFGYRRDDAIGKEMAGLIIPPGLREAHRLGLARYLATGEGPVIDTRLEITGRRADGTEFPVELTITRLPSAGPPVMVGFLRDITERKVDERRLAAHHAVSHALVESDTVDEMAQKILAALGENLEWESGVFWQIAEQATTGHEGDALIVTALWQHRAISPAGSTTPLPFDKDSICSLALHAMRLPHGIGLIWQELGSDGLNEASHFAIISNSRHINGHALATLAFPVRDGDQVLAVIQFFGHDRHPPDEEMHRMAEAIGSEVGQFLRRKRLEMELRQSYERQSHIAEWLQEALRPALAGKMPGLDSATYYRPALDEASIGGDFFDVFALDSKCSALVVADLSGKGLAAAAQIATVRHMLRALLYEHISEPGRSLARVIMKLNDMLADHDLLKGFATLFAGIYDAEQRTLTYASCGQEPGLILRRTTGTIEEMEPTGPVLGGFSGAAFEERVVGLAPGDLIALFTDGLTEAGRSRKELLGVLGVSAIFRESVEGATTVAEITARMIAGVETAATPGGIRDDVCLLVARVE